jgi:hypothetical protein
MCASSIRPTTGSRAIPAGPAISRRSRRRSDRSWPRARCCSAEPPTITESSPTRTTSSAKPIPASASPPGSCLRRARGQSPRSRRRAESWPSCIRSRPGTSFRPATSSGSSSAADERSAPNSRRSGSPPPRARSRGWRRPDGPTSASRTEGPEPAFGSRSRSSTSTRPGSTIPSCGSWAPTTSRATTAIRAAPAATSSTPTTASPGTA